MNLSILPKCEICENFVEAGGPKVRQTRSVVIAPIRITTRSEDEIIIAYAFPWLTNVFIRSAIIQELNIQNFKG